MGEIYYGEPGLTYGDGHYYGEDDASALGKLWQFAFHVGRPSHHSMHSSVKGAINLDSTLVHAPISGMRINTDATLGGLTAGEWTLSNAKYSSGTGFELSCDTMLGTPTGQVAIAIGTPGSDDSDNAVYLTIDDGNPGLFKIVDGAQTPVAGSPNPDAPITVHTDRFYRMRLTVDFAQQLIEAVVEDAAQLAGVAFLQLPFGPSAWPDFGTDGVFIALYDSTGTSRFSNLRVDGRKSFLDGSMPYQNAINPKFLSTGKAFKDGVLDMTLGSMWNGKNLDNVSDGTTRFAVASVNGSHYPDHIASTTNIGPAQLIFGTGAPTSAGSYPQGSIYVQTDGAAGARLWYRTGVPSWVASTAL